jgi:cytochrome c-type biogenesis protein CcmH
MRTLLAILALVLAFASVAFAQTRSAGPANPDPAVEQRLKLLAEELRCLVCQNQTIADSNATLAIDLRNQIRGQIAAGKSDGEIRDYMVQRYGDFVLYKPPFQVNTIALWVAPVALLVMGVVVFLVVVRRRRAQPSPGAASPRRAEIEKLLDGP